MTLNCLGPTGFDCVEGVGLTVVDSGVDLDSSGMCCLGLACPDPTGSDWGVFWWAIWRSYGSGPCPRFGFAGWFWLWPELAGVGVDPGVYSNLRVGSSGFPWPRLCVVGVDLSGWF